MFPKAFRRFEALAAGAVVLLLCAAPGQAGAAPVSAYDGYYGDYRIAPDHWLGIDRYIDDSGESVLLFSDYQSGVVRRLYPVSATEFVMGPGFQDRSPTELTVDFRKDAQGAVTGASLRSANRAPAFAARVPIEEQQVTFRDGDVTLAGTLLTPGTPGPHPAIVLLHGSGPLTRWSFGPYPHFFASLGFAVLIYDKRGTGASTGTLVDASTTYSEAPDVRRAYYPNDLTNDALAALAFLKARKDIDPHRIGFWGSSEGGMLTTQVAARSKDVAFIIDSSGFMGPLWRTLRHQAVLRLKAKGLSGAELERGVAFIDLWLRMALTGQGWDEFVRTRDKDLEDKKVWATDETPPFASLEQAHWVGDHIIAFSPLPALDHVSCPVLAVYGEKDVLNDVPAATENLRAALAAAGHKDFTIKVFPNAGHSLAETPSGARMAPGVFETLRAWLRDHAGAGAS